MISDSICFIFYQLVFYCLFRTLLKQLEELLTHVSVLLVEKRWKAKVVMCHLLIFRWDSRIQKLRLFRTKGLQFLITWTIHLYSGHLASALAAMICRAVCYFMPCDLDFIRRKIMKVPLKFKNEQIKRFLNYFLLHFESQK